jgi:hypothetical protein
MPTSPHKMRVAETVMAINKVIPELEPNKNSERIDGAQQSH